MPNYFILVTADVELASVGKLSAQKIIEHRIAKKVWPIYRNTKNLKHFTVGDQVLLYQGGRFPGRQCIVGVSQIASIRSAEHYEEVDPPSVLSAPTYKIISLANSRLFAKPLSIKPLMGLISFLPKGVKFWGVFLMGGCRKITKKDYDLILDMENRLRL